jgi:hypothetical protein
VTGFASPPATRQDACVHTREIPDHVLDQLLIGLVYYEAELTLERFEPGGVALLSDSFGSVFTWLWQQSPAKATVLIADFLAQLRFYHHSANPALDLEAVLQGLPPALRGVSPEEVRAIQDQLRVEVPQYVSQGDGL